MKKVLLSGINIYKNFTGSDTNVLEQVNIEIFDGDFTIIMGSSGAGKSTLLYALSGMDSITSGKVLYKEREITTLSKHQMADLWAKEFGFVFQQTHLVSNLTLFENIAIAGYISKIGNEQEVTKKAEQLLLQMGVNEARNRFPQQTSGGESQRAAIARAMMGTPGILFADEPTGALNKSHSIEVLNLLSEVNDNRQSILMVTHDLRAAIRGTRILFMEDGKILDELTLIPYKEEDAKIRETKVNTWLTTLRW